MEQKDENKLLLQSGYKNGEQVHEKMLNSVSHWEATNQRHNIMNYTTHRMDKMKKKEKERK